MRILGMPIPFTGERRRNREKGLVSVTDNRGWYPLVREPFAGAWQRNVTIDAGLVPAFHANFACQTLIASDISKLRVKLVHQNADGVWIETASPSFSPVLQKPNGFQNRIQFWESWVLSKLSRGNAYVLKQRDGRNVVTGLYVLDPNRVQPLVSEEGEVYYRLSADNLSGIQFDILVPAREMIHDRMNCLFHPLVGISPLFAAGRAAQQGLNIQNNSIRLFENNSSPGGILTAPGEIKETTARRLKDDWEANFTGKNFGRVAVLGDGLKYEKMALTAVEGQLIEQLRWTAEVVCSTYHVPAYKIGVGPLPSYNNVQSLNVEYYSQCLQALIEAAEVCLDEGLSMPSNYGSEFDLDGLLRMDSIAQIDFLQRAVGAGIMSPNEARRKVDLQPTDGGEAPYLQQQNYSLAALAKRDAQDDPFGTKPPPPPPQQTPPAAPADNIPPAAAKDALRGLVALKQLIKFNPNHDPHSGEFSSGGGGGGGGGGGEDSDAVHANKFEITKPRVQRAIDVVTKEEKFPADRIDISAERRSLHVNGADYPAGAAADDKTGKITIYAAEWSGHDDQDIRGMVAHEIMHQKFASALKNDRAALEPMMSDPKLIRDDGITEYSKEYWKAGDHFVATHETLAEIARLKWTDPTYRVSHQVSDRWLKFFDEVNGRYKP